MIKPKQCPKCNSTRDIIPIQYGFPSPEMMEDYLAGKIELGGCVMDMENWEDPKWRCKKCDHRWK